MKKSENWMVCGGGIRAIIAAFILAKRGKEVTIFNEAPFLGGVLNSGYKEGFYLDKGCHLFANTSVEITDIFMELIGRKNYNPIDLKIGNIFNGEIVEGIALPDLTKLGKNICSKILYELLNNITKGDTGKALHLADELKFRFGETAQKILTPFFFKAYQEEASNISSKSINDLTLSINRIKILNQTTSTLLKSIPEIDNLIAVSSKEDPLKFVPLRAKEKYNFLSFYPKNTGLHFFCQKAKEALISLGVKFVEGERIERIDHSKSQIILHSSKKNTYNTDKLFWGGNIEDVGLVFTKKSNLKSLIHKVPMVLFYFIVNKNEVSDYTYIHNFDESDTYFRISIPPNYGENLAPKGKSYICCEIPTQIGSEVWNDPESFIDGIWNSFKKYGIVKSKSPDQYHLIKTPVSYKVPKVGWEKEMLNIKEQLPIDRIFGINTNNYSKNSIINSLLEEFQEI